jgi:hypothetical protein
MEKLSFTFVVAIGIVTVAIIGVLLEWFIKQFLPKKPNSRHRLIVGAVLLVLICIASLVNPGKQTVSVSIPSPTQIASLPSAQPEMPTVTIVPTLTQMYSKVSIDGIANSSSQFETLPLGDVTFDGVPFSLTKKMFKSQANPPPYDNFPISASLKLQIPHAYRIYLLLNSGDSYIQYKGKTIGRVFAYCDSTSILVSELILGKNIREWLNIGDKVVASASDVNEVWTGRPANADSLNNNWIGNIDMISVDLPQSCRDIGITEIEIDDITTSSVNSLDPNLNLIGITIEYYK